MVQEKLATTPYYPWQAHLRVLSRLTICSASLALAGHEARKNRLAASLGC